MLSRPIWAMLMVGVFLLIHTPDAFGEDPPNQPAQDKPSRPVMRVTHADIQGKVFIASARQGVDEKPASNVKVQIRELQNNKVLREAITDKEGYYSLPMLDPAQYLIIIGSLKLQLNVEPEVQSATELPKILLVILPEEMTQFRE